MDITLIKLLDLLKMYKQVALCLKSFYETKNATYNKAEHIGTHENYICDNIYIENK